MVSTDPYSTVHAKTLYSTGYVSVKRKCNVFQTFITKVSVTYINQGDLMARDNGGGPKDRQFIVTVSRDA